MFYYLIIFYHLKTFPRALLFWAVEYQSNSGQFYPNTRDIADLCQYIACISRTAPCKLEHSDSSDRKHGTMFLIYNIQYLDTN